MQIVDILNTAKVKRELFHTISVECREIIEKYFTVFARNTVKNLPEMFHTICIECREIFARNISQ